MLQLGKDGVVREYKEPYTTIEVETEEDYNELLELLELGRKAKQELEG